MSFISYGCHPRQIVKKYHIPKLSNAIIIFIHGGAWRDPNNTCNDTDEMVNQLKSFGDCPGEENAVENFYSIDYRLSPEWKFPSYIIDVLFAVIKIKRHLESKAGDLNKFKFYLAGHSVGALLTLQFLDFAEVLKKWWNCSSEPSSVLDSILETIDGVEKKFQLSDLVEYFTKNLAAPISSPQAIMLDGIYNLEDLVCEYSSAYEAFVLEAHESRMEYLESTHFSFMDPSSRDFTSHKILVIQSTKDELLSPRQTENLLKAFDADNIGYEYIIDDFGAHNNVYVNKDVTKIIYNFIKNQ
ncbi:arylformamidase [Saccharomycopsis crataegensis]|uniref:Arylformamidase n=1 Tax=Saccharomycopsis crataegensis TaxID=43959 RepID=A0AAV5QQH7_9ASCO|nr:arylformamidase [Saccharomycopsis crataegensis]